MGKGNIGEKFFLYGAFLLATAPLFSAILFLISIFKSSNNKLKIYLKNWWNKTLFIVSALMIISCFFQNIIITSPIEIDKYLTWIGLINWIPFFWCFWAFQPYLENTAKRKRTIIYMISGTVPIIISGLAQYFFNITGPWEFLYGMITWYQRPLEITDGLTGPFNNANYAGAWLTIFWPFLLAIFNKESFNIKKIVTFVLIILFVISILFTNSRNAWMGLLLTTPIVLGKRSFYWTFIVIILLSFLISTVYFSLVPPDLKEMIINLLPYNFMSNFPDTTNQFNTEFPRLEIWKSSLSFIHSNPIIGWGGSSFPLLYQFEHDKWIGHAHNLPFEIAISYGILPSIFLTLFVTLLLFKSINLEIKSPSINFKNKSNDFINKAWICSTTYLVLSHIIDIQYFDIRISLVSWILLAGIKCSFSEASQKTS